MSYTPGPWKVDFSRKPYSIAPDRIDPTSDFKSPMGVVFRSHVKGTESEQIANANLIAASPQMLEALKYTLELVHIARQYFPKSIKNRNTFMLENYGVAIDKAIRKAEGKED